MQKRKRILLKKIQVLSRIIKDNNNVISVKYTADYNSSQSYENRFDPDVEFDSKLNVSPSNIPSYRSSRSTGTTSYSSGGGSLTSVTPTTSGTTAICDFADISFTSATITARGAMIYNSSNSNKAVCILDFGGDKTSTSGTFTIQFPAADASNAILRLA